MSNCGTKRKMSYGGKVKKMEKGGKVKPGYHKMPDGKIMKDSAHKKMNESKLMKKDGRNVAKAKMQKAKTMKRGGKC